MISVHYWTVCYEAVYDREQYLSPLHPICGTSLRCKEMMVRMDLGRVSQTPMIGRDDQESFEQNIQGIV